LKEPIFPIIGTSSKPQRSWFQGLEKLMRTGRPAFPTLEKRKLLRLFQMAAVKRHFRAIKNADIFLRIILDLKNGGVCRKKGEKGKKKEKPLLSKIESEDGFGRVIP
jgi:hypothetical protein